MTTMDSLEHFMEVQLQTWGDGCEARKKPRAGPVLAITREPGCNGELIARALAAEFGLVVYDWKIVEQIAKDAHVSEKVVATLDEKVRSQMEDWLADFTGSATLSTYQYQQSLRRVLFAIAAHGDAVMMGRGANFLLPPEKKTLGLCLVAPLEAKVKNIMQARRLSRKEALRYIIRTEKAQQLWVSEHGQADIHDPTHYHVVINTALISVATLVQLARDVIRGKK